MLFASAGCPRPSRWQHAAFVLWAVAQWLLVSACLLLGQQTHFGSAQHKLQVPHVALVTSLVCLVLECTLCFTGLS